MKYVTKTMEPKKFRKESKGGKRERMRVGKREEMKEEGRERLRISSWKSSRLQS